MKMMRIYPMILRFNQTIPTNIWILNEKTITKQINIVYFLENT
jgi:type I restriction-modification system DNA methylase subunit